MGPQAHSSHAAQRKRTDEEERMMVEFKSPSGTPWSVDPSDVSRVLPSSVEPESVTEVYTKDGAKHYADEEYGTVVAKLNQKP